MRNGIVKIALPRHSPLDQELALILAADALHWLTGRQSVR